MNLFGERQHPEKFIPLIIRRALDGEKLLIHSDEKKENPGSRFYIHCRNMASALLFLIDKKSWVREKFNIVGEKEVNNLELALLVAEVMGKPLNYELVDFHSSRPGHDLRYALDGNKLSQLGWEPPRNFEVSLEKMVRWTLKNLQWLEQY